MITEMVLRHREQIISEIMLTPQRTRHNYRDSAASQRTRHNYRDGATSQRTNNFRADADVTENKA